MLPLVLAACAVMGCASSPTGVTAAPALAMRPAVWAPKRMVAPIAGLTRSGAERILAAEASKECGSRFESRWSVMDTSPAAFEADSPGPVLILDYACLDAEAARVEPAVRSLNL